ncbi:MAG: sigma-70 family RNA polymerase sigma factor [Planctomycetota bacterium]
MSESHVELVTALLEQESFIRQLARGLLSREDQVEDVVQETWIAALRRPPLEVGRLRAWLAAVVSNLARRVHRDEARRRKREERGARPEPVPSARELFERLALQRRIIDEVASLPETDRLVLLLRFTEGLSSEEIGERTGLNPSTVRTRVQRTLARLRHRLDEGESSGSWRALLAPLALGTVSRPLVPISRASGAGALGIGAGIMSMAKSLGVVATVVLVGALWWMLDSRSGGERALEIPVARESEAGASLEPEAPDDPELPVLTGPDLEEELISKEPPSSQDPSSSTWTARVLVFDAEGRPVSGARVECWTTSRAHEHEPPDEIGWSDGAGLGAFEIAVDRTVVRAEHPQWGTSGVHLLKRNGPEEARLELLAKAGISGSVTRADGAPARGVEVELSIRGVKVSRFVLGSNEPVFTDADGRFQLDVESGPEYALRAVDGDQYSPILEIAPEPGGSCEVNLQFPGRYRVHGTLLDPFDHPFPDGRVFAWPSGDDGGSFPDVCGSVLSDDRGRFELLLAEPGELVLIGIGSDHGRSVPIRISVTGEEPERDVDLKLASTGSIFGRVSSPEGEGIVAVIVATPERVASTGPDSRGFFPPQRGTANADGRFVLEGLHPEQSYRVEIWPNAEERERKLVRRGIRVGDGPLVVVVTEEALRGSVLEGRVVAAATGLPITSFEVLLARERSPGRWTFATSPEAFRDEEGRFAIEGLVSGDRYSLLVQSTEHGAHVIDPFTLEEEHELLVRLKGFGSLEVRVIEADGSPAANVRVEIVRIAELPLASDPPGAHTDETGLHLFERVPAARYWATGIRGDTRTLPVEVEVDGPTHIELSLPEGK